MGTWNPSKEEPGKGIGTGRELGRKGVTFHLSHVDCKGTVCLPNDISEMADLQRWEMAAQERVVRALQEIIKAAQAGWISKGESGKESRRGRTEM